MKPAPSFEKPIGRPGGRIGISWDLVEQLGKVPDSVLAAQLGCTTQNVAGARKARGIPAHKSPFMRFAVIENRWAIERLYTTVSVGP